MAKEQVKEILDRVLTWAEDRQSDAAEVLTLMEEQDRSGYRLTDEQAVEVRRRLAKKNPNYVSLHEARAQFSRSRA